MARFRPQLAQGRHASRGLSLAMIRATSAWLSVLVVVPCVHYCIIRFVRNALRGFRERVRVWTIAVIIAGCGFQGPPSLLTH